jgi:hypothetical protein
MQVHLGDCPKLRFKLGGSEAGEMHPDVVACAWNLIYIYIYIPFFPNAPHRRVVGEVSVRGKSRKCHSRCSIFYHIFKPFNWTTFWLNMGSLNKRSTSFKIWPNLNHRCSNYNIIYWGANSSEVLPKRVWECDTKSGLDYDWPVVMWT